MKVLFAVSNENISESIVKKYQKDYKEIISYKNVYYFNAILKEIQKDKSYDRIIISEDLEPFANNNYDAIDKFLFEKLDSISDEATGNDRNDTPIILICTDRRNKAEEILVKLFGIGIYNAVIGKDRSIDEICRLIRNPRTKKEAKAYYKIESDEVNYQSEKENDVSEIEIQNIIGHYKKLGKNEEKYIDSFNNIASQYNDVQLKLIASFLPLNVKAVLEARSPKYQEIMMKGGSTLGSVKAIQKQEQESGIKVNYIENKDGKKILSKPVIVPQAVNFNNVKKVGKKKEDITELSEMMYSEEDTQERIRKLRTEKQIQEMANVNVQRPVTPVVQPEPIVEEIEEQPKKRRGRPKKVVQQVEEVQVNQMAEEPEEQPKKRRGRPKKVVQQVEPTNLYDLAEPEEEEAMFLPGLEEEEPTTTNIKVSRSTASSRQANNVNILPGLEDEEEEEITPVRPSYNNYQQPSYTPPATSYASPSYANYQETIAAERAEDNSLTREQLETTVDIENLLTADKKIVAFLGTSKNGTSFLVNNIAALLSASGISTAILDLTQNRNSYFIYTKNEEELRRVASESIPKLRSGIAQGIKVDKSLSVYTAIPNEDVGIEDAEPILKTLLQNHSLILLDCDFNTDLQYLANTQEIYLVQSMDILTIQPLTEFLRELKAKNILQQEKLRIVLNKVIKVRSLTEKAVIGGMSYYNDPEMSFMTELFDRNLIKSLTIRFEEDIYSRYLEGLVNCKISLNGYSKEFLQVLKQLGNMVYPLIGGKTTSPKTNYAPMGSNYGGNNAKFSNDMNSTLDKMKSSRY